MSKKRKHFKGSKVIPASPLQVFNFANNYNNFSSHMKESSWMMGGGRMNTYPDSKNFQEIGSHLKMEGDVFGIKLFLDEVITKNEPPKLKEWQTLGDINLVVIGHYKLGFVITPVGEYSRLEVYIDYELPNSWRTKWLGILFGGIYAKWCVNQMLNGVYNHFKNVHY